MDKNDRINHIVEVVGKVFSNLNNKSDKDLDEVIKRLKDIQDTIK